MVKIMTTPQLKSANKEAVRLGFNRALTDEFLTWLDPDGYHIVNYTMHHQNHEGLLSMRVVLMCKLAGSVVPAEATIDLTYERYARLSVYEPSSARKEAPMA